MKLSERIKSLRKEAQMSQRVLAKKVEIDFTYLSKIENARVKPPSEKVLMSIAYELAGELGLDKQELADELTILGKKVPSDLAKTLRRNPQAVRFLRSIGDDVKPPEEWDRLIESVQSGG